MISAFRSPKKERKINVKKASLLAVLLCGYLLASCTGKQLTMDTEPNGTVDNTIETTIVKEAIIEETTYSMDEAEIISTTQNTEQPNQIDQIECTETSETEENAQYSGVYELPELPEITEPGQTEPTLPEIIIPETNETEPPTEETSAETESTVDNPYELPSFED